MKKFVVLVFAIAALAFLSELTARDGFSFAFGFPIPIPSIDGPVYYNPIPKTVIIRDMSTMAGYYGPYWRYGYYYGRRYYVTAPTVIATMATAIMVAGYYGRGYKRQLLSFAAYSFSGTLGAGNCI